MSKHVRRLTELAVLTAVSLIIFIVELQIPNPFPIPGIKLGLANIITVYAVYHYKAHEVAAVIAARLLLGAVFSGNFAALVYSGGKSVHAIVKVEASNADEYRKRVQYLYNVCKKNGLDVDKQNKNPSRLSRMPGVIRRGKKQYLLDTNIGKESWAEWEEWIESINDDLPDPESLSDVFNDLPDLAPPLIDGILRQGHKMLIAGPSKAGKSFSLIELTIAIAEGRDWYGYKCAKGRVLYVNLELDKASCLHRFADVYKAHHWEPDSLKNIDIWHLRGKASPMDKLAPKLIRRAMKKGYIAVIIDPIYKVLTGDENSAEHMSKFCNEFDKICAELNCAVIYCHHHSKGAQGGKKSMDRASGSGVFARDPDAMLDLR